MAVDLGAVVGRVVLEDAEFQRTVVRVRRTMVDLGSGASKAASGTGALDEGLGAVSASATKATTSIGRTSKAAADVAVAMDQASKSTSIAGKSAKDSAVAFVALGDGTSRQKTAALSLIAAEERLQRTLDTGTATTEQYARAQSSVVAAQERVAVADKAAASATSALAASQREATVASRGLTGGMAGTLKMAGELGLVFGAFELVKKGLDITKEANEFHRSMVQVQTNADVSAAEVGKASKALLEMAGPVAAAPNELAVAWYHAKSVGLDYAKSIEVTRIAAEGARVGHADLEQTMNALTSTVASGIPGVQDMSSAMGQLIAVVGSGDMKLSDLNDALGTGVLVRMKQYGLSLTDVGAALATFGDNNIRGADAATLLRMSVEAMAKQGKPGEAALARIGIQANQLRDDMQKGGLNKAVLDLNAHLKAAGITGNQVGGFLIDAFTKKGGGGVAVLLGQVDRLESKFEVLRDSGASFGDKWKATTQTASFALASLEHQAESAGIQLTAKLGPSIAQAARLFAVILPQAIDVAVDSVKPFIEAGRLAGVVLVPLTHAVGDLASDAKPLGPTLKIAASGALSLYAATKLLAGGKAVFTALNYGLGSVAGGAMKAEIRMRALAASTVAVARGQQAMSLGAFATGVAAVGVAGYAAGRGLNSLIEKNNSFAHTLDNLGSIQKTFTAAMQATNGVLNDSVRTTVAAQLQSSGLADRAAKAGISLKDLTGAVTGGDQALAALGERWKKDGAPSGDTLVALDLIGRKYQTSAAAAQTLATVTAGKTATTKTDTNVTKEQALATQQAAAAAKAAAAQTKALDTALQNLAQTQLAQAQSEDAFKEGLLGISSAVKDNGRSLSENTSKGLANRDMLLQLLGQAVSLANAQRKNGASINEVSASLQSNIKQLEATARAAGLPESAIKKLVAQMGLTPKDISTKFHMNIEQAVAAAKTVKGLLAEIANHTFTANVSLRINAQNVGQAVHDAVNGLGSANGTGPAGLPLGLSSVGEQGPELAYNDGKRTHIIPNGQSRQIARDLAGVGVMMPGFAKGTPGSIAATQSWLRNTVDPQPYVWGAAGPKAWDCSGLVGGVIEHLTGRGKGRLFSTSNEGAVLRSLGFKKGAGGVNALMVAGWNSEHTTGSVGGLKFEAYGSNGVARKDQIRVGSKARDPKSFPNVMYLPNGADGVTGGPTKPGGNPKGGSSPAAAAVSTAQAAAGLFGSAGGGTGGGSFASQLLTGVSTGGGSVGTSSRSVAASRAAVLAQATGAVNSAITSGIAPDPSEAQLIGSKGKPGVLGKAIGSADDQQKRALIAGANYTLLAAKVTSLKTSIKALTGASTERINKLRDQADADTRQARALSAQAAGMATNTKAQKAAKKAVEAHARALRDDAANLRTQATEAARNAAASTKSLRATLTAQLTAAQTLAASAKDAYGTISQAAKDAMATAAQYAKTLVDDVQADADTLTSTISDFKSSMTQNLLGSDSVASIWGTLSDAVTAAKSDLVAAQDAVNQAAVGGGKATADQLATLAAAQAAYTSAMAADTASGVQASLSTVLQNAQTFSADLTKLVGEGANQDLITQITSLGTTSGDALAQQLLAAGPDAIAALQTTMASIQSVAGNEAQQLANSFYGPGATAMIQFVQGLESQFPALTAALQAIVTQISTAAGVPVPIVKPPKATTAGGGANLSGTPATAHKGTSSGGKTPPPGHGQVVHYALGTNYAKAGVALVGELGPELLQMRGGERVTSNRDLNRIIAKPAGMDDSRIVERLAAIEQRLVEAPGKYQEGTVAVIDRYGTAHGRAQGIQLTRAARGRG